MQLSELKDKIDRCVSLRIPFAVYAMPSSDDYHFICSMPDEAGENEITLRMRQHRFFEINTIDTRMGYHVGITDSEFSQWRADQLDMFQPLDSPEIRPAFHTTPRIVYDAQLHQIIDNLKRRRTPGKVVISRVISGERECPEGVAALAEKYFALHPESFRNLYFTQETGLWMGATPEILLDYDFKAGECRSMALAGTRPIAEHHLPWDAKNVEEQRIVADFVSHTLLSHTDSKGIKENATESLAYGNIEHLCTTFSAHDVTDPVTLAGELNPTPAVVGYPRDMAMKMIARLEAHQRYCYSGTLSVYNPEINRLTWFVNLRCAHLHLDEHNYLTYNIYTGSGITAKSSIDDEWAETEAKTFALRSILSNSN